MNSQSDNTHQPLDEAELRKQINHILHNWETLFDSENKLMALFQSQLAAAEQRGRLETMARVRFHNRINKLKVQKDA